MIDRIAPEKIKQVSTAYMIKFIILQKIFRFSPKIKHFQHHRASKIGGFNILQYAKPKIRIFFDIDILNMKKQTYLSLVLNYYI